jgi:hypothetical protein
MEEEEEEKKKKKKKKKKTVKCNEVVAVSELSLWHRHLLNLGKKSKSKIGLHLISNLQVFLVVNILRKILATLLQQAKMTDNFKRYVTLR